MRRAVSVGVSAVVLLLAGCSDAGGGANQSAPAIIDEGDASNGGDAANASHDGGAPMDATFDAADAPHEGNPGDCLSGYGSPGTCMLAATCESMADRTAATGNCPGADDIACCIKTPSVADNPPIPAGWKLLSQSQVTTEMTNWAVMILHDPVTYPMFSETIKVFNGLTVMARVEWHPPDFQNSAVHRGVTLYEPTG